MRNILKKIFYSVLFVINSILLYPKRVLANDDPWAALADTSVYTKVPEAGNIYSFLELVGILGCVLTTIFYVVVIIFHPEPKGISSGKDGFKWKLIVAFCICVAGTFMALCFDFVSQLGGYQ